MKWTQLTSIFIFSSFKFMFTPLAGPGLGLTFIETYLAAVAGGIFGAAVFYFPADYFMLRSEKKKELLREQALKEGKVFEEKKRFTKMNRFIVNIKMKMGIIGISFWAPFFLSVPIGSIITAKFYGKEKITFPLICLGMGINAVVTTGIAFLIY